MFYSFLRHSISNYFFFLWYWKSRISSLHLECLSVLCFVQSVISIKHSLVYLAWLVTATTNSFPKNSLSLNILTGTTSSSGIGSVLPSLKSLLCKICEISSSDCSGVITWANLFSSCDLTLSNFFLTFSLVLSARCSMHFWFI